MNKVVSNKTKKEKRTNMLYIIGIVLIILWIMGLLSSYTLGGFIHALLVIAILVILIRVLTGQKPL